jgi:hypothetical protein
MKTMGKMKIMTGLIVIVLMLSATACFATIDPGCDPLDPGCPIDGGVSLLIAAGVGLGVRRAMKKNANP